MNGAEIDRPPAATLAAAVRSEFAKNKSEIIALSCPAHFTILPSDLPRSDGQAGRPAGTGSKPRVAQTCGNHATAVIRTYIPPLSLSLSDYTILPIWGHPRDTSGRGSEKCTNGVPERARKDAGRGREEREKIETRPEIAFRRSTTQYMPGE